MSTSTVGSDLNCTFTKCAFQFYISNFILRPAGYLLVSMFALNAHGWLLDLLIVWFGFLPFLYHKMFFVMKKRFFRLLKVKKELILKRTLG